MANAKYRLPVDSNNQGPYLRYNDRSVGGFTVYEPYAILQDPTLDQQAAITAKALQGAYGLNVQAMRDAGRVIFSACTVIGGVACVTTEALLSLVPTRDAVASGGATTHAVTSGKRLFIETMLGGILTSSAAVLSARLSLRCNPSGVVVASSPIIGILPLAVSAAVAQLGAWAPVNIEQEFSGTMQIGATQVCSAVTGLVWVSLIGYEF